MTRLVINTNCVRNLYGRYLDRPVFQAERVAAAAWTVGGAEAEREARTRLGMKMS